jgi:large subunit ribosomal protein L6
MPVEIPKGVTVDVQGSRVTVKGPKGELAMTLADGITAACVNGKVDVGRTSETKLVRSCHGMSRSLIANMIEGVSKGYSRSLELQGVGFRATVQGKKLSMALGFSRPVEVAIPDGIKIDAATGTEINISGPSKQLVGQVAAHVRSFYPAEPYKGKGLRYKGEYVRRKVGKTVA